MKILEVESLTVGYKDDIVLEEVTFSINEGEIVAIVGPNGSGKSTLFNAITGLINYNGSVKWFGHLIDKITVSKLVKDKISYQNDQLPTIGYVTVFEYMKFFCLASGKYDINEIDNMVYYYLDTFWIRDYKNKYLNEISKGTKQRLSFASMLLHNPHFLILDEPTSGVDIEGTQQLKTIIKKLSLTGKSILIDSHHLNDIEGVADRVLIIKNKKIYDLDNSSSGKLINYILRFDNELNITILNEMNIIVTEYGQDYISIRIPDDIQIYDIILNLLNNKLKIKEFYRRPSKLETSYLNEVSFSG